VHRHTQIDRLVALHGRDMLGKGKQNGCARVPQRAPVAPC